jgi:hypothetical protein
MFGGCRVDERAHVSDGSSGGEVPVSLSQERGGRTGANRRTHAGLAPRVRLRANRSSPPPHRPAASRPERRTRQRGALDSPAGGKREDLGVRACPTPQPGRSRGAAVDASNAVSRARAVRAGGCRCRGRSTPRPPEQAAGSRGPITRRRAGAGRAIRTGGEWGRGPPSPPARGAAAAAARARHRTRPRGRSDPGVAPGSSAPGRSQGQCRPSRAHRGRLDSILRVDTWGSRGRGALRAKERTATRRGRQRQVPTCVAVGREEDAARRSRLGGRGGGCRDSRTRWPRSGERSPRSTPAKIVAARRGHPPLGRADRSRTSRARCVVEGERRGSASLGSGEGARMAPDPSVRRRNGASPIRAP